MPTHIPYPSIEQFRNVIRNVSQRAQYKGQDDNGDPVYDYLLPKPTLKYLGNTKLHGTNFAIGHNKDKKETWFQSREQIITPEKDNAGAARFFHDKDLSSLFDSIDANEIVIYGEWIGKSIQRNVAICQLEKRMVVFDALADEKWLKPEEVKKIKNPDISIYNIYDFPTWEIEIDFSRPEESQNKLVELTTKVADLCPVGVAFGVEGIGEGIVWRCQTEGYENPKFIFKVKDERHQTSGITKLKEVDTEAIRELRELATKITPTWRLEQMLEQACDLNNGGKIDRKFIGSYLKLVNQDILKEEKDVLGELDYSKVAGFVAQIAKQYFLEAESKL